MITPIRVAVIGAGVSGLAAIKSCLEDQLDVVCYERTNYIAGLWNYSDKVSEGVACVMKSTVINSSKELSAFSDFPPPTHFPNFMHHTRMNEYLNLYAEKFNLKNEIRFNHEVLNVEMASDYETTGDWIIRVKNESTIFEDRVNAVMVCSGHHCYPHIPEIQGLSKFKGEIIHTHSYRSKCANNLENKRVLVVGIGNSGGDVCVELNRRAKQVYLCSRSGAWVVNRVGWKGLPIDSLMLRRINYEFFKFTPTFLVNAVTEAYLNSRFDHGLYNLKPQHHFWGQHVTVNDDLPNCILAGTVVIKDDVNEFTETGVKFAGEEKNLYEIDAVVMATGYLIKFPFIDKTIVPTKRNKVTLYKYVFPPNLTHSTLAIIGLIQPFGALMPISEMQTRWAVQVFQGKRRLPSETKMLQEIKTKAHDMKNRYSKSPRHTVQVDYMEYMDEIGDLIGVKPSLMKMLFTDPMLFLECYFGPNVPYLYRLEGVHSWPGAKKAIMTVHRRIKEPLQTCPRRRFKRRAELIPMYLPKYFFTVLFIFFILACIEFIVVYVI